MFVQHIVMVVFNGGRFNMKSFATAMAQIVIQTAVQGIFKIPQGDTSFKAAFAEFTDGALANAAEQFVFKGNIDWFNSAIAGTGTAVGYELGTTMKNAMNDNVHSSKLGSQARQRRNHELCVDRKALLAAQTRSRNERYQLMHDFQGRSAIAAGTHGAASNDNPFNHSANLQQADARRKVMTGHAPYQSVTGQLSQEVVGANVAQQAREVMSSAVQIQQHLKVEAVSAKQALAAKLASEELYEQRAYQFHSVHWMIGFLHAAEGAGEGALHLFKYVVMAQSNESLMQSNNPVVRQYAARALTRQGAEEAAVAKGTYAKLKGVAQWQANAVHDEAVLAFSTNKEARVLAREDLAYREAQAMMVAKNPQTAFDLVGLFAGGAVGGMLSRAGDLGDLGELGVGGGSLPNFASKDLLESHFIKHGGEFKGAFSNPDEYLAGAHDVIKNGIKVEYVYRGETRVGYVRFAGATSQKPIIFDIKKPGVAKFEFVGTNKAGDITTFHIQSGKDFWKTINDLSSNKNITPYEYLYPEEKTYPSLNP
jgi:hypothetical protein